MHLSTLTRILESVHLTLDVQGRVPDLTVCDAINAGTFDGSARARPFYHFRHFKMYFSSQACSGEALP